MRLAKYIVISKIHKSDEDIFLICMISQNRILVFFFLSILDWQTQKHKVCVLIFVLFFVSFCHVIVKSFVYVCLQFCMGAFTIMSIVTTTNNKILLMNFFFFFLVYIHDWLYFRSHTPIEITLTSDGSVLAECKREKKNSSLAFSLLRSAKKRNERKRSFAWIYLTRLLLLPENERTIHVHTFRITHGKPCAVIEREY